MLITLRTDTPVTELALLNMGGVVQGEDRWESGRELSSQLLEHLQKLLLTQGQTWDSVTGVVVFRGPGSFTGLRIGVAVANAIAYAQEVPIVGTKGDDWVTDGIKRLQDRENDRQVLPEYGALPHITKPGRRLDASSGGAV